MRLSARSTTTTIQLAACTILCGGCLIELDIIEGQSWLMRADPAQGSRQDNSNPVPILTSKGDYPGVAACVCPVVHELISNGKAGLLPPGSEDEEKYHLYLDAHRAETANSCLAVAAEVGSDLGTTILFDTPSSISCADAASDEIPILIGTCPLTGITCSDGDPPWTPWVPGTGGEPEPTEPTGTTDGADSTGAPDDTGAPDNTDDGGSHVFGLDEWTEAVVVSGADSYKMDIDFVDLLVGSPELLADDNIGVGFGMSALMHKGFEFRTVGSDSIANAIGFQAGDVVWELNGASFSAVEDITEAFETMVDEDVFVVRFDRGSQTRTLTVTIVDLASYP